MVCQIFMTRKLLRTTDFGQFIDWIARMTTALNVQHMFKLIIDDVPHAELFIITQKVANREPFEFK